MSSMRSRSPLPKKGTALKNLTPQPKNPAAKPESFGDRFNRLLATAGPALRESGNTNAQAQPYQPRTEDPVQAAARIGRESRSDAAAYSADAARLASDLRIREMNAARTPPTGRVLSGSTGRTTFTTASSGPGSVVGGSSGALSGADSARLAAQAAMQSAELAARDRDRTDRLAAGDRDRTDRLASSERMQDKDLQLRRDMPGIEAESEDSLRRKAAARAISTFNQLGKSRTVDQAVS